MVSPRLCALRAFFKPNAKYPPKGAIVAQKIVMTKRWASTAVDSKEAPNS